MIIAEGELWNIKQEMWLIWIENAMARMVSTVVSVRLVTRKKKTVIATEIALDSTQREEEEKMSGYDQRGISDGSSCYGRRP